MSCSKGDFDGAIAQYILTIGKLEPSYVIRKVGVAYNHCAVMLIHFLFQFLDAQRIHNLTNYLKVIVCILNSMGIISKTLFSFTYDANVLIN